MTHNFDCTQLINLIKIFAEWYQEEPHEFILWDIFRMAWEAITKCGVV